MKREHILKYELETETHRSEMANSAETYQEDCAFLNRMRNKPLERFQRCELQRLWRIAERGMEARK